MPGVVLLIVALVVNYVRHKAGHRTICQCIRRTLPRPLAALGLAGFFCVVRPSHLGGVRRPLRERHRCG